MLGSRLGSKTSFLGSAVGSVADDEGPGGTLSWTVDATSGIAVPASNAEWSAFIASKGLAISAPGSLWNAQEASGNLSDAIGSLTLTAGLTPSYQQTVSGWARHAVTLADGTGQQFTAGVGSGPDPSTTSQAWFGVISLPATPTVQRAFWGLNVNNTSSAACRVTHVPTTGKLRLQVAGVNVDSTNAHSNAVHPLLLKYDRTNGTAVLYTDLEKLSGTYSDSVIDQLKGFGSAASDAAGLLWGAMWSGAAAEALSDANVKALLQAMGYDLSY